MDRAIAEIGKALKEADVQLGVCLRQTLDVLQNHEERLGKLEKPDVRRELVDIERFITDIEDPVKKEAAMAEFAALCNALGIEDLED